MDYMLWRFTHDFVQPCYTRDKNSGHKSLSMDSSFHNFWYNAESSRDAPSGAGGESALDHLLTPHVVLGMEPKYVS